jgi:2-hydroxychromene-2-carboxylate isomerase
LTSYDPTIVPPVLYIDPGSPYAYLAAERAPALLGVAPRLEAIALGAVFRHRGRGSWAHTDERERRMREVEDRARSYGLPPVRWPDGWPPNTLHASRAVVWMRREQGEDAADAVALALLRAAFRDGADLADHGVIARAAAVPPEVLEAGIADPAVKEDLRARTEAAIALGVPGVPTLQIGNRLTYGDDRLAGLAET